MNRHKNSTRHQGKVPGVQPQLDFAWDAMCQLGGLRGERGLRSGVQVIGRRGEDATLALAVSKTLQDDSVRQYPG